MMHQEDIVSNLQTFTTTTDNAIRSSIEAKLEQGWTTSPSFMMLTLQRVIGDDQLIPSIRVLAAVLLRRGMGKQTVVEETNKGSGDDQRKTVNLFSSVPLMEQQVILDGLVATLKRIVNQDDLQKRISDVIAEAARLSTNSIGEKVLVFVIESLHHGHCLSSVLRIVEGAPAIIPNDRHRDFNSLFRQLIVSPTISLSLLSLTAKAVIAILTTVSDQEKKHYLESIRAITSSSVTIPKILASLDEEEVVGDLFSSLIDGIVECPKMFKDNLFDLCSLGTRVAANKDIDFGVRSLAIELSLCLVEQLTSGFTKKSDQISIILSVVLQLICEVEDCQEWYEAEGQDGDEDIDEVGILGEQCLDRLAIALTGRYLAEPLFKMTSQMLSNNPDWKLQYGALKAIASSAEGCMDVLEDRAEMVLSLVFPSFHHSHPRVQYAACHALGQLCTDYDGLIQKEFCKESLECLIGLLSKSQTVRVQQHAAAALVNFAEGVDSKQLSPFLDEILSRLVSILSTAKSLSLQQQLIATISSFSGAAEGFFAKYLGGLIPIIMNCLQNSNDRLLQCRSVEAMSLFALAVGKQVFFGHQPAANDYMEVLKQLQSSEMASDDQMADYLQSAWVRMCQVLKADFTPFLSICLPRMIQQAQLEADLAVLDADTHDENEYDKSEWDFAEINGRMYGINTATLEEKCTALENIAAIADTMGQSFAPFAQDCLTSLALPLLSFDLHDGVAAAAADLVAASIRCIADKNVASQLAVQAIGQLIETAKTHYSPVYTTAAIDSLHSLISLDLCQVEMVNQLLNRLEYLLRYSAKRVSADNGPEEEEDEHQDSNENDDGEVVYSIARCYATICKTYKQAVYQHSLPFIKFALEQIGRQMHRKPVCLVHSSVCILVDAIQWIPAQMASDHAVPVSQALQQALTHEDRDVKQAAVYGVGVAGETGLLQWQHLCGQVLPLLIQFIQANPRTASNSSLLDNVVSAIIKIVNGNPGFKDRLSDFIEILLSGFPILNDSDEFINCYTFLDNCLQKEHSSYLNKSNVLEALLEATHGSVAKHLPEQLCASLKSHIISVMQSLGPQASQPIIAKYNLQ